MRYPSIQRSNMRYRGPMESRKFNKLYTDSSYDLSYLYKRLEELKEETTLFRESMKEGGNNMSSQYGFVQKKEAFLRGGDSRE